MWDQAWNCALMAAGRRLRRMVDEVRECCANRQTEMSSRCFIAAQVAMLNGLAAVIESVQPEGRPQ
jgi:hypothetical protein